MDAINSRYEKMLDELETSYEKFISNYALEETENYTNIDNGLLYRRFVFNRGISDYPIIVNPAGQIVEMDDKTPLDLIMQVTNASISCAYDQLCRI